MYVCLCNGYRESDLRDLAAQGVSCPIEAYTTLGNGPNCGQCLDYAQDIMDEAQAGCARLALSAAE